MTTTIRLRVILVLALSIHPAFAAASEMSRCDASKGKAAALAVRAKLTCHAKLAQTGTGLVECLSRADEKFASALTKAQRRADCVAPSSANDTIATAVNELVANVVEALPHDSSTVGCFVEKVRAAGR